MDTQRRPTPAVAHPVTAEAWMSRLYSSWIGRALLATVLVTVLFAAGAAEAGPLAALLLSMLVAIGAVALRRRRFLPKEMQS